MNITDLIAWALTASTLVTDMRGYRFTHGIPREGAEALAAKCVAAPLFKGDDGTRCLALALAMAGRESGFSNAVVGDCWDPVRKVYVKPDRYGVCPEGTQPRAFGPFQSHSGHPFASWKDAADDWWPLVQKSMSEPLCAEHPLAMIASGSCTNKGGQAKSDERMTEARRVWQAMRDRDAEQPAASR